MTTLVVSATEAEAAHVPAGLEVVVTGIGKTAAAALTTEALLRRGATTSPSSTSARSVPSAPGYVGCCCRAR